MEIDLICLKCKHFGSLLTCEAFPKGIPDDIISGENDHIQKHPKQGNNITFELDKSYNNHITITQE